MANETEQLKDVVLIVGVVEEGDGVDYAGSRVFRFDLEGDVSSFIKHIESYKKVVHSEKLGAVV